MYEPFVSSSLVAKHTKGALSVSRLAQLRYTGKGPVYYNPTPRTILYKLSEVDKWLEASARTATHEDGDLSPAALSEWRDAHGISLTLGGHDVD